MNYPSPYPPAEDVRRLELSEIPEDRHFLVREGDNYWCAPNEDSTPHREEAFVYTKALVVSGGYSSIISAATLEILPRLQQPLEYQPPYPPAERIFGEGETIPEEFKDRKFLVYTSPTLDPDDYNGYWLYNEEEKCADGYSEEGRDGAYAFSYRQAINYIGHKTHAEMLPLPGATPLKPIEPVEMTAGQSLFHALKSNTAAPVSSLYGTKEKLYQRMQDVTRDQIRNMEYQIKNNRMGDFGIGTLALMYNGDSEIIGNDWDAFHALIMAAEKRIQDRLAVQANPTMQKLSQAVLRTKGLL